MTFIGTFICIIFSWWLFKE